MTNDDELSTLKSLLLHSEIITPDDASSYHEESKVWAQQRYQHPKLIVRPSSLESMSKAVKFLGESSLDFRVRNGGAGNASATDVVLSSRAFKSVEFDGQTEVVYLGAGALWAEYYEEMERVAPEYTGVVPLSCPRLLPV